MTLARLFCRCRALPVRARTAGVKSTEVRERPGRAPPFHSAQAATCLPVIRPFSHVANYKQQQQQVCVCGGGGPLPFALSLPSLQPQIPPQPKCRLSAPSSRAARNSEFRTVPPARELREAASLWRRAGGRAKRALYLIQATPPHLPCALGENSCHWLSHFA